MRKELDKLLKLYDSVKNSAECIPDEVYDFEINPTLEMLRISEEDKWILIWKNLNSDIPKKKYASKEELYIIKCLVEDISLEQSSQMANVSIGHLYSSYKLACEEGYILGPKSKLTRKRTGLKEKQVVDVFTLQWHITNSCDLYCKHCYDRNIRSSVTREQANNILDDLVNFCMNKNVGGHMCFSGGNPFLHPDFAFMYENAVKKGFSTSILANPIPEDKLQNILNIRYPNYYQVSLEGLEEHNDEIRGNGNFKSVINFLEILKKLQVSSNVMLTLTHDNIDQALPLTEFLRDKTDSFTFNRLSQVGQGANLLLPNFKKYEDFLGKYIEASKNNPIIKFKDNLINIVLEKNNEKLFDGCTGFGCGAAFNFLTLLPDGEAHACRKFPSKVGSLLDQNILDVYESDLSEKYRQGAKPCEKCSLQYACGGCMAAAGGYVKDVFKENDPFCFRKRSD